MQKQATFGIPRRIAEAAFNAYRQVARRSWRGVCHPRVGPYRSRQDISHAGQGRLRP
jgi:hypothetical protein